jgi:hypothetical protein
VRLTRRHGRVAKSLRLHDALHVGRPSELTGDEDARRVGDPVGDADLLDLVAEDVLFRVRQHGERDKVKTPGSP